GAFPVMYQDRCDVIAGSDYVLVIRRSWETQELSLKTIPFPLSKRVSNWALNLILLAFLGAALTVFLLKPHDRQAWLLALMLGTFTGLFEGFAFGLSGWMLGAAMAASIVGLAFLPISFHFFLIFPENGIERGPLLRRFPRLEYLLYLPFLLTILPYSGLQRAGDFLNIEGLVNWLPAKNLLRGGSMIFVVSYLVGCLVAMVGNYRAANANARRKLRFVVAGCSAGVLNLLLIVLGEFIGIQRTRPQFNDWLRAPLLVTLPLIPFSFAYAIIRHQVIPVSLIIRRSVRYVLVSRGAILLDLLAVVLSVSAVLTYIFSRIRPPVIVIGLVSAAVGIVTWKIASGLHDRYLRPLIDRRFFRQSYDAHQIIAELTGSLRTVTDLPQLLELVATKLRTALQTEHVTIYLRDPATGSFSNAYSCDYSRANSAAVILPHGGQLAMYARMAEQLDQLEKSLGKT